MSGQAKSPEATKTQTGARHLVDGLVALGVDRIFCVPGESYLAVLDALGDVADRIDVITCRHEAGAANMAEAHAKLTGRPGVCFVTRGPGATHASVGVHTASQDSTPMILFVGQVARADRGRGAFQEVDYRAAFGPLAKWADEIDDAARVPEFLERAWRTMLQGRRGPVVLALPEDMLVEEVEAGPVAPFSPARAGLAPDAADAIREALAAAQRPVFLLGGSGWSEEAARALADFADSAGVPVVLSFRRKSLIDNDHPAYGGDLGLGPNPKLIERLRQADLIVAIGARLGENPTQGYALWTRAQTAERLIHIHPGAEEIGRVWPVRLGAVADSDLAAIALTQTPIQPCDPAWRAGARGDYESFTRPVGVTGAVNPSELFAHMAEVLPPSAILTNGAGNYAAWLHRFFRHRGFGGQIAPTSGAMGYGLPAAIAAKLAAPEREVFALAGDGCFLMAVSELATAAQHGAPIRVIVLDNGGYGTIRMHQERAYPGRVVATGLRNPDFAALAESMGGVGLRVEQTGAFPEALAAARAAKTFSLIHVRTRLEDIAPGRTLAELAAKG